jgi:diguanylate cyclase (GGDEF)-like protein
MGHISLVNPHLVGEPGGDYLVRRLPLSDGLILQALIPEALMTAEALELRISTIIWLVISSMVLLTLLHIVLRRLILKPVNQLRDLMQKVSTHEIRKIDLVDLNDEMAELHNHFAGMLGRLEISKRELEKVAFIDPLTSLSNRAAFIRCLQSMVEKHSREQTDFFLTQLKLHNLTWINHTFGANVGDRALQFISQMLLQLLREHRIAQAKCVSIARSGSDEFSFTMPFPATSGAIVLPDAEAICAQLAIRLNQPITLGNYTLKLRFSAGIIHFPVIASNVADLMEGASRARRQAARYQESHWQLLNNDMVLQVKEDKWLESELRAAIKQQQCFVVYQPQYDLKSGHIASAEVLMRWRHPLYGLVPPDRFIPIAEHSDQILEIDLWVLEQACIFLGKLIAKGISNFRLAVNASGNELSNSLYPEHVRNMLHRYDIPACYLAIEITETAIVELDDMAKAMVHALKEIGVEIELDDFGTGYTSLSHLSILELDSLKIDRSYIVQLESNPKLVDSILQLADAFSLKVIAEGIETIEQLQLLQQKNCDLAQGYLLSKPISEEAMVSLLLEDTLPKKKNKMFVIRSD